MMKGENQAYPGPRPPSTSAEIPLKGETCHARRKTFEMYHLVVYLKGLLPWSRVQGCAVRLQWLRARQVDSELYVALTSRPGAVPAPYQDNFAILIDHVLAISLCVRDTAFVKITM